MAVTIPSFPQHQTQTLTLTTSAIDNTPQYSGPRQRVSRLGDRWKLDVTCRPLPYTQAVGVVAALVQGTSQRVVVPVQQPGLTIGTPGSPVAASAASGGTTISASGFTASYAIQAGQYCSVVHGGKRFLHIITSATTATAGGAATLSVWPMLRTPITAGDVLEFASPKIEGFLATTQAWSVGLAKSVGLTFVVEEAL
jgi:hypothetical protein